METNERNHLHYDLYWGMDESQRMDDHNEWIQSVIYITGTNGRTTTNLTTNGFNPFDTKWGAIQRMDPIFITGSNTHTTI